MSTALTSAAAPVAAATLRAARTRCVRLLHGRNFDTEASFPARRRAAADASPCSSRSCRVSRVLPTAAHAAVRPAKAFFAGTAAHVVPAAMPARRSRRAVGAVRAAVADAAKEETFTYQAEARAATKQQRRSGWRAAHRARTAPRVRTTDARALFAHATPAGVLLPRARR
jgi:hypothetical protein